MRPLCTICYWTGEIRPGSLTISYLSLFRNTYSPTRSSLSRAFTTRADTVRSGGDARSSSLSAPPAGSVQMRICRAFAKTQTRLTVESTAITTSDRRAEGFQEENYCCERMLDLTMQHVRYFNNCVPSVKYTRRYARRSTHQMR